MAGSGVSTVVSLCHRRWAVPLLAELGRDGGAKLVTLQSRLGVGREALRQTLPSLIDQGWLARNPGYGHPMRPEYVLTARGAAVAPACRRLWDALKRAGLERAALYKWTLPVLLALHEGDDRFHALKARLPAITPRALAAALRKLQEVGLAERSVTEGYPPQTCYRLTPRGRRLAPLVAAL